MHSNLLIGALIAITVACGIGFLLPAPSPPSSTLAPSRAAKPDVTRSRLPVVLVGLDGATLRIIEPMLQRGQLPTLARIKNRGVHGVLRSIPPGLSPQVWTSMITGVHPAQHGISGFLVRIPGHPISTLLPVSHRRVPAIWNLASQRGLTVGVVGWWATWPAEPVNGFVVSHTRLMLGDPDRGTHPASLESKMAAMTGGGLDPRIELQRLLGVTPRVQCPRGIRRLTRQEIHLRQKGDRHSALERLLCREIARDVATVQIARSLYASHLPDLLLVYLRGLDAISHRFWKHAFPKDARWRLPPSPEDLQRYKNVLHGYYRFSDGLLQRMIDAIPRATVIIVSDHGFGPEPGGGQSLFDYNLLLADLGYLQYSGPGFDWSRTTVVHDSVSWEGAGKLYLNLVERSPQGIVPASDYKRQVADIVRTLKSLRTVFGQPLFDDISSDPIPPAERDMKEPDITLRFNPALKLDDRLRVDRQIFPMERYRHEHDASGAHFGHDPERLAGILFAAGQGIARRKTSINAGVLDVMPTLTCLLGIPQYTHFEGQPLAEVLSAARLRRCHRSRATIEQDRDRRPEAVPRGSQLRDEQLRKKLRSLGYID